MNGDQEEVSQQEKGQDKQQEYLPIPHVICRKWATPSKPYVTKSWVTTVLTRLRRLISGASSTSSSKDEIPKDL
jgi:hypothetical protein